MLRMKSLLLICMTFVTLKSPHAAPQTSFLDNYIMPFRLLRSTLQGALQDIDRNQNHQRSLRVNEKLQPTISNDVKFPCPLNNTRSNQVPQSVNKLKPGDIKVIGAIGDSLTAGFGLTSLDFTDVVLENRGLSFTAGGQYTWRESLTLPNILKTFNPHLIGFSLKTSTTIERASQFNVAEGGAVSDNTPYMAKVLVKRIQSDPRVNLTEDWKMINILIGANDFCSEICYNNPPERVLEKHKADILQVLRTLRDNLPRTFVNLIPPPDVAVLTQIKGLPQRYYTSLKVECPCIIGMVHQKFRKRFENIIARWQDLDIEIANYKEFDREDFQVVAQTLFINFSVPLTHNGLTDFTYLAADCFHFSQKGGALVANLLWNNLLQPVRNKHRTTEKLFAEFNCPTKEFPYLFTKANSV